MKTLKFLTTAFAFTLFMAISTQAQTSCCSSTAKKDKTQEKPKTEVTKLATSGCSPSGCRGAKTKMGEAKVISNLRLNLIDLKAEMETSKQPKFDARSYDIHDIIGKTDDESLKLIIKEIKIVESAFNKELNYSAEAFQLPKNKAKQIKYLTDRIKTLKDVLSEN